MVHRLRNLTDLARSVRETTSPESITLASFLQDLVQVDERTYESLLEPNHDGDAQQEREKPHEHGGPRSGGSQPARLAVYSVHRFAVGSKELADRTHSLSTCLTVPFERCRQRSSQRFQNGTLLVLGDVSSCVVECLPDSCPSVGP